MRKQTLSPSKISAYLACPVKYKWTYVDDRGKWYLKSKSYYSFGTSLHSVLQRFHDSGDEGVTTTHQAIAALEESWIDAGYSSQDEMMEALAEGKAIVETYLEGLRMEPVTAKTILIEKTLRKDLGAFTLLGRLDRVDERDDGTLEIVDYKSGRDNVTSQDIQTDLAMSIYQILVSAAYPGKSVLATIVALRTNRKASYGMAAAEIESVESDLKMIGAEIMNRDFENMLPVRKPLCEYCDFLPLCSKHPEF